MNTSSILKFHPASTSILNRMACAIVLASAWVHPSAMGKDESESLNSDSCTQSSTPWYIGARLLPGAAYDDTTFLTLPAGATGGTEESYDPQESGGAELVLGYHTTAFGIPMRAELSGGFLYRHDADMKAFGISNRYYQNDLRIWDVRISLMADIVDFGWGRFYVGAGVGAALLDSQVETRRFNLSADHKEWKLSPSAQAGIIFNDVFASVDLELAYRFRWFGDTESGTFPTGAVVGYDDLFAHELLLGFTIPIGK